MSRYSVCTTALLIVSYWQCVVHTCVHFVSLTLSLSCLWNALSLSRLGGCPLNRPLHIGGRTSPLPRVWCPHTVPVLGLDGRSGSNWQGPWLALCARPLPSQLIGTASGQQRGRDTAALRLMDGYRCQESFFLTRKLVQSIYCLSLSGWCMYLCMYSSSFVLNILESWLELSYCALCFFFNLNHVSNECIWLVETETNYPIKLSVHTV